MTGEDYSQISCEVAEGVATLTLDRPEKLNAYTPVMRSELLDALDRVDADDGVRAVVLTGRGRGFCAGADLQAGAETFDAESETRRNAPQTGMVDGVPADGGGVLSLRIAALLKPVIVAYNGPAVGVGVTMTLPADVRIAADEARFGFVFARRGIVPEAASSWFLPRLVGISQAMEWTATGRVFDATEAHRGGLVSRLYPRDELLPAAYELAREIAENTSAVSVALARQMMWGMLSAGSPWEAHRLDSRAMHALGAAPDAAEGVTAFLEKRPPAFPMTVPADLPDIAPRWPAPPGEA
jgi:enoyl-CoA hydratase/carnithine racemase